MMGTKILALRMFPLCAAFLLFSQIGAPSGSAFASSRLELNLDRTSSFTVTDRWYSRLPIGEGSGIAVSRVNPLTVFVSGYFGVRKSTDGGETWSDISSNLPAPYDNQAIWVASDDDNLLYVSHYNHGWFKSINGGASWQQIFVSPPASIPGWSVLSASDHDVLYMQTYSTLYRTSDGGATWEPLDSSCSGRVTAVDPQDPDTAYFVGNTLLKTTDAGKSCFQVSPIGFFYVGTEFGTGGWLYGITQYPHAFYRSTDGGATWTQLSANGFPSGSDIWGFAVDPNNRKHLLVNATDWGIRESCDGGRTWTALNDGYPVGRERPIAIGFHSPYSYYSMTDGNGIWQFHSPTIFCPSSSVPVTDVRARVGPAGNVTLLWRSVSETQLAGFNVWRRIGNTKWQKINAQLVQAKHMGESRGSEYRFKDRNVRHRAEYRYKIEVIDVDGHTAWTAVLTVNTP